MTVWVVIANVPFQTAEMHSIWASEELAEAECERLRRKTGDDNWYVTDEEVRTVPR